MDEDLVAFGCVLLIFVSFPLLLVASITSCIAYSRTKTWSKNLNRAAIGLESTPLTSNASDGDESDFFDTDDEEEHDARKAEEQHDRTLTFGQKFRKEFRKVWSGKGRVQVVKEREREERRKLAKAVARELERRERRKARRAEKAEELPPYKKG